MARGKEREGLGLQRIGGPADRFRGLDGRRCEAFGEHVQQGTVAGTATGDDPPPGYEDVAKAVGVPLTLVTMNDRGKILKRELRESFWQGKEKRIQG